MKRNSWKTFLSVVLLLTMLMSMLPFAAFAEDSPAAATQTEETAKTDDAPKVGEKTGDAPKADDKAGAAKTEEKSGDAAKDAAKDTVKDAAKDESKDAPKDDDAKGESKDAPKDDAAKDDAAKGDTEHPPKGDTEDPDAQVATLEADDDTPEVDPMPMEIFLTYEANGGNGGPDRDGIHIINFGSTYTFTIKRLADTNITAPDGYTFSGWNTQPDGAGRPFAEGDEWEIDSSAPLYAQWTPEEQTPTEGITLTYNANGGTGSYIDGPYTDGKHTFTIKSLDETNITAPTGFRFNGWNTEPDGSGESVTDTYGPVEASFTLYAQWVIDITLTYDANGGTGSDSETKTFKRGEPYTFTVKARSDTGIDRDKHNFRYWTDAKDGTGERYSGGNTKTFPGDTTLYAQWQYVPQKINILYSPNYSSMEPVVSESATEGESYPVKGSNTFRPPYNKHFVNWNTASDGSGTAYEAGLAITAPGNDLTLYAQWADDPKWSELGIDISAPDKELPGAGLTYAIKVTNGTGYDLNSVVVNVALPEEVTYNSQSSSGAWSLSYDSATHTVTARLESVDDSPVLALNGTSEFSLPVEIKPMVFGTIEAKATIASAFSRTGHSETGKGKSDTARTTMSGLDISVTATPAAPTLGETITYKVTVTNNTGLTLSGITINNGMNSYNSISMLSLQSSLSDGWDFTSTSKGNLCDFYRDLAPGASSFYKLTTSFINADNKTATCTATITSISADGRDPVNGDFGSASATATLKELDWSNLKIEKTVDKATAGIGDTLNYEIKVTNNTGYDLSYLCVEDPTPTGTSYPGASQSSGKWFLSIPADNSRVVAELQGGLAKGASETFFMEVAVDRDEPSGKVENTAKITSAKSGSDYDLTRDRPNGLPSNTVTTVIDPMFNLDIEVRALQPVAEVGEDHKFSYQVTVTNKGVVWLAAAKIENILPTGVGTIVGEPDQNCGFSSDYSTVEIYSLPKDESVSYTITTNFIPGGAAAAVLEAKITSVTTRALNTYTGSKSDKDTVYSLAGLTITKDVDKSEAKPGDTLIYTVEVNNTTALDLTKLSVDDILPAEVTYDPDHSDPGDWSFDTATTPGTVKATLSNGLAVGGKAAFKIAATVNAGVSGTVTNTAKITEAVNAYGSSNVDRSASVQTEVLAKVPVNVTVMFNGLKDVSQVPAGYKLTGADANAFLKGDIKLDPAESKTGHVFRKFSTEEYVRLGQEYSLSFTQSDYDIPGYICTLTTATDPIKVTAQDASASINVDITLSYVKENLFTYPSLTVRTYFKGLTKLPDSFGYKLNCISAPEEATAFQGPLTLTQGTENGVPYLEFSAKDVTLQAGVPLTFSFTQSGYDVPGYLCAPGNSTFKFTLPVATTDARQPLLLKIENTYTQPDWSKLTVTKTADKELATPGSTVNYTVTVMNNTGVDLSNITVADTLDSRLRYSGNTGGYSTGTSTWTVASLANGKSVTLTLTVKLKYGLAAGSVIENTASITEASAAGLVYDLSGQKLNDSVIVTVIGGKGSPRTGDESNLGLWAAFMAASLVCAGAAAVIYKKRRG